MYTNLRSESRVLFENPFTNTLLLSWKDSEYFDFSRVLSCLDDGKVFDNLRPLPEL